MMRVRQQLADPLAFNIDELGTFAFSEPYTAGHQYKQAD